MGKYRISSANFCLPIPDKIPPKPPPFPRIPFPNLPQLTTVSFSSAVTIVTNLITGAILNSMASVCKVCVCPARKFPLPLTGPAVSFLRHHVSRQSTQLFHFTARFHATCSSEHSHHGGTFCACNFNSWPSWFFHTKATWS